MANNIQHLKYVSHQNLIQDVKRTQSARNATKVQGSHLAVSQKINKPQKTHSSKIITRSKKGKGVKSGILGYFKKATGGVQKKENKQTGTSFPGRPCQFDTQDHIKLSLEARDEIRNQQDPFAAIRERNPINMKAFCENLGLVPPEETTPPSKEGVPLKEKLEIISMRTAGKGWE
ncbi:MAG: hypothetical protein ACLFQV_00505 [Vulcanimicrobiota bacterium]